MSVLMTLRIAADPGQLEKAADARPDLMTATVAKAREHGLISHHFYADTHEVLVVDEWPDEASFHAFFDATPEVREVMTAAGAKGEPEVTFWRKLSLGDDYPN
jgi:quinol monooxygenase YgiN